MGRRRASSPAVTRTEWTLRSGRRNKDQWSRRPKRGMDLPGYSPVVFAWLRCPVHGTNERTGRCSVGFLFGCPACGTNRPSPPEAIKKPRTCNAGAFFVLNMSGGTCSKRQRILRTVPFFLLRRNRATGGTSGRRMAPSRRRGKGRESPGGGEGPFSGWGLSPPPGFLTASS